MEIDVGDVVQLAGIHHFNLLNHQRVYEHLARFLGRERVRSRLSAGRAA